MPGCLTNGQSYRKRINERNHDARVNTFNKGVLMMLRDWQLWHMLPAEGHTRTAPRYKVTFVVWTAIFPTVFILSTLLSLLPFEVPLLLSVFVITAITVPSGVYILLPRLYRLFDPWVYRESKAARGATSAINRRPIGAAHNCGS